MRKPTYRLTLAAGAMFVALSGATALAISSNANSNAGGHGKPSTSPEATTTHGHAADKGNGKLADAKLKSCQAREAAVQNIISRIVDRGTKQIAVFDSIATKTEDFYTSKGKTVANYDALVQAVTDAKTKAQTDLANMKTNDSFTCTSNDPKGGVKAFQSDLKLEIADLKAYKTAVRNLIVGVKSAQGSGGSDTEASGSPKPSTTPTHTPTPTPTATPTPTTTPTPQGGNN